MYEAVTCQCDTVGVMDDFALAEYYPFIELFSWSDLPLMVCFYWSVWGAATISYLLPKSYSN